MSSYELEFEKPLAELEKKIISLQKKNSLKPDEQEQLRVAEHDLYARTVDIYQHLTCWQTVQVARHKDRPHAVDFLRLLCDDFFELHGDRSFSDNPTIVGGPATFAGQHVMFLAHEKGRSLKEKRHYNAAMAHPEGNRKAYRLMQQAEKFGFPLLCLIDTPGAAIAFEDEERGQSNSIAENILLMSRLRVPVIAVVIGEGGSGGALALGVADRLLMLEHAYYAVAAPESVASIAWRDTKYAREAAEGQLISAKELIKQRLVDEIVPEPIGGAHRDERAAATALKDALQRHLLAVQNISIDTLIEARYQKYRAIGPFRQLEQV